MRPERSKARIFLGSDKSQNEIGDFPTALPTAVIITRTNTKLNRMRCEICESTNAFWFTVKKGLRKQFCRRLNQTEKFHVGFRGGVGCNIFDCFELQMKITNPGEKFSVLKIG